MRRPSLLPLALLVCLAGAARAEVPSAAAASATLAAPAAVAPQPAPAEGRMPSLATPEAPPAPTVTPAAAAALNREPEPLAPPVARERLVDDLVFGVALGGAVGLALSLQHTLGNHPRGLYIGVGGALGLVGGWYRWHWRGTHPPAP